MIFLPLEEVVIGIQHTCAFTESLRLLTSLPNDTVELYGLLMIWSNFRKIPDMLKISKHKKRTNYRNFQI